APRRFGARGTQVQPLGDVLVDAGLEVIAQLVLEIAGEIAPPEAEVAPPGGLAARGVVCRRTCHQPLAQERTWVDVSTTETALENAAQDDASARSSWRPRVVSR